MSESIVLNATELAMDLRKHLADTDEAISILASMGHAIPCEAIELRTMLRRAIVAEAERDEHRSTLLDMESKIGHLEAELEEAKAPLIHDTLRTFAEDMAEHDCTYPDSPCLAVHISKLSHGMCTGCKARAAIEKAATP